MQMSNNIVFITDHNYLFPTVISIKSLIKNSENKEIIVNIVAIDLLNEDIETLKKMSVDKVRIEVYSFSNEFSDLGKSHHYVSRAALYKFKLPEIFNELDKILYVDGDILFNLGFLSIFDINIGNYYMAAVRDVQAELDQKRAEIINNTYYFNSGVLLLNLSKMRKDRCSEKMIEYKKNDPDDSFMDQNAINKILGQKALPISPRYNMMATVGKFFSLNELSSFFKVTKDEMANIISNPFLYHMTGKYKPWNNVESDSIEQWLNIIDDADLLKCLRRYIINYKNETNVSIKKMTSMEEKNKEMEQRIIDLENNLNILSNFANEMYRKSFRGVLSSLKKKFVNFK